MSSSKISYGLHRIFSGGSCERFLSLFFHIIFFLGVHIRSPLKCEENERVHKKKEETEKKCSKQGGEGNMRLIRIASEEKREVISRPVSLVSGKTHFFQDTGQTVRTYACPCSLPFFVRKKEKKTRAGTVFFLLLLLFYDGTAMSLSVNFLLSLSPSRFLSFLSFSLLSICMCVQYVVY